MTIRIIGLTGKKGHGKDTASDIIQKRVKTGIVTFSFAEPIKKALSIIHVLPQKYFDDHGLKETPHGRLGNRTPRQVAQWLGTDIYRILYDKDTWINNMKYRINDHIDTIGEDGDAVIVITDCRFDNEAEYIKSVGGEIWKIDASRRKSDPKDDHPSEKGIGDEFVDFVIDNNGDVAHMEEQINTII